MMRRRSGLLAEIRAYLVLWCFVGLLCWIAIGLVAAHAARYHVAPATTEATR